MDSTEKGMDFTLLHAKASYAKKKPIQMLYFMFHQIQNIIKL